MLLRRTRKFYIDKVRIDKSVNQRTAYKIQLYNDYQVDELVKNYNEGETISKPTPSKLWADLAVLNKPEVYKNYNHIINSKYTSNDNLDNLIIKNLANKDLNRIVEAEVERISKNLDYAEQVIQKYEVPMTMYEEFKKKQAKNSIQSRQQILKDVAIKANDLLVSEGLNIPNNYTYRNIETPAENLLRQSQMGSKHQEILAINTNYKNQGKDEIYTGKEWIWTGRGETTRHRSNHLQKRQLKEPFIIVNDKTLHIDELMYPSDPAGSFSNAWICYCECQYLTGDARDYQNLGSLSLTDTKFKVNAPSLKTPKFMTAKQFNKELNKPSPVKISQPVATNIQDYMNVNVGTSTPSLIDDSVDGITSVPHNYLIDGSKVNVIYDAETGKYYYNGLELKEYDVQSQMGKVSKAAVTKHNENIHKNNTINKPNPKPKVLEPQTTNGKLSSNAEVIDLTKFKDDGTLLVDVQFDGVVYNNETGHWEYKGLWVKDYSEEYDIGTVYIEDAKKHNDKINGINENSTSNVPKSVIHTAGVYYNEYSKEYTFFNSSLVKQGNKVYVNGLDVTQYYDSDNDWADVPKTVIEEHNAQLHNSEVNNVGANTVHNTENNITKEPIMESDLINAPAEGGYLVETWNLTKVNDKYYLNGLEVHVTDENKTYQVIPKQDLKNHNKQFETEENTTTNNDGFKPIVQTEDYIHHKVSDVIMYGEDIDGQAYAVDKRDGRQWVLDEQRTYEQRQDDLQKQIPMDELYDSVHWWGHSGYEPINWFNYLKKKFEGRKYKKVQDKMFPLFDELRSRVNQGKSITNIENKINNTINEFKNSGEFDNESTYNGLFKVINAIKEIDIAMAKSPPLQQDTCFIRAGYWKPDFNKIGEVFEWEGYAGITYNNRPVDLGHEGRAYNITILAPKGTRGVRLSRQFGGITQEREWLLPRGQKFRVLEFDDDAGTCTIELIPEEW